LGDVHQLFFAANTGRHSLLSEKPTRALDDNSLGQFAVFVFPRYFYGGILEHLHGRKASGGGHHRGILFYVAHVYNSVIFVDQSKEDSSKT
jgi:hypothetical protein